MSRPAAQCGARPFTVLGMRGTHSNPHVVESYCVTMTSLQRSPHRVLGPAIMGHRHHGSRPTQQPRLASKAAALPRLVFHLAREDGRNECEDEQWDLQLARLDEHLNRGIASDESGKVCKQHTGRRRREHVECELLLLRLNEVRELGRNLAEGEYSIDVPARARDAASLIRGA